MSTIIPMGPLGRGNWITWFSGFYILGMTKKNAGAKMYVWQEWKTNVVHLVIMLVI